MDTTPSPRRMARLAALERLGAPCDSPRQAYQAADVIHDTANGVLYIAADLEPSPGDWAEVCDLLHVVGYRNGADGLFTDDPGEPAFDAYANTNIWRLSLGRMRQ